MIYVNHIIYLIKYGIEKNRGFLRSFYEEDKFNRVQKWFDYLKSFERKNDKRMTLEKFLLLIDEKSIIHLGLAYPDPDKIRYSVRLMDKKLIDRFVFIEMPYGKRNFNLVSEIYKNSFGRVLEKEKVREGIREEYERTINSKIYIRKHTL
ncbi:MAG: hypothetical protein KKB62_02275 [Nanoarchaeota archaeon]|nr:hypothetical protein [Nanoarchaeota archaeon]